MVGLAMLLIFAQGVVAAGGTREVKATWGANTEADLGGYKLYWGMEAGAPSEEVDVGNVVTKVVTCGEGRWYFSLSAYDVNGNESVRGAESTIVVDVTAPGVPGGLVLQVVGQ